VTDAADCPLSFDRLETGARVAEAALAAGRYREALDTYSGLLRGRLSGGAGSAEFAAADLVVIERLVELAALFGLFAAADDLLDAMVVLCREAANDLAGDYATLKRVELSLARGALREPFDLLAGLRNRLGDLTAMDLSPAGLLRWERVIAWRHHPAADRAVLLTRAYLVMGRLLAALGSYGDALSVLERGLAIAAHSTAPDLARRAVPSLHLARAATLLERGDLDDSEAALGTSGAASEDSLAPALRTRHLELAGKLDLLRGRLGSAVRRFEAVIELCRVRGFTRAGTAAGLNLAHVLVLQNRVGDALRLVDEARTCAAAIGDTGLLLRAEAIASVALARRRSSAAAVSVAASVREMLQGRRTEVVAPSPPPPPPPIPQSADFLAFFEDRALEFEWALGSDLAYAENCLRGIRDTFQHTDSALIAARVLALEGLFAFARHDDGSAADTFARAATALARLGLDPELWQVQHFRARCLERLGRTDDGARLAEDAEALLARIAGSLDDNTRALYLLNKATVEEQFVAARLDGLLREYTTASTRSWPRRLLGWTRVLRRLDALLEHLDAYKAILARRHVAGDGTNAPALAPGSRTHLRALLARLVRAPRHRALVAFLVLPDRVLVIWSTFFRLGFAVSPITRLELRETVRRWHELARQSTSAGRDLGAVGGAPADPAAGAAEALMGTLVERLQLPAVLAALPARVRALSFMPDDVLHGLPFAAAKCNGRYLIEDYAVSIAFETGRRRARRRRSGHGVVVGVSRGDGAVPALPNAAFEAASVARWLSARGIAVTRLVDDASRAAVLDELTQAWLVHLACHGTFEPDRPDRSGLLLIPRPGQLELLTLRDLSDVRLACCTHVTLSSCWSADSFILPGRWIISLPETLWRSGAESTLASLWPVDDAVALSFMVRFYDALSRLPRDAALREVQLACLGGTLECGPRSIDTRPPFHWAGFNLSGDSGRLRL
jgi:tetratricopeptide (TPR) repeat protein